jgi:hypothetical protein
LLALGNTCRDVLLAQVLLAKTSSKERGMVGAERAGEDEIALWR